MKTEPTAHDLEKLAAAFESDTTSGDAIRIGLFEKLQNLHGARLKHVEQERARLAGAEGEDHPAVAALTNELMQERQLMSDIRIELEKTRAGRPQLDEHTWVLHGHVLNSRREPQPAATVSVCDRSGRWLEGIGHGCTDANGYFQIRYSAAAEKPNRTRGAQDIARQPGLRLQVTDAESRVLYRDKSTVSVQPGHAEYRLIVLNSAAETCAPPPDRAKEEVAS